MRQNGSRSTTYIAIAMIWFCLASAPQTTALTKNTDDANLCLAAARHASDVHGIPLSVLAAISLTETGRAIDGNFKAWPWATNVEGQGHWFEDRTSAENYILEEYARGARSYDIGCFQINYRWHPDAYSSPLTMFDPMASADYAARFLKSLFQETGDWGAAAGAYHSRTARLANKYQHRFEKIRLSRMHLDHHQSDAPESMAMRNSQFPLLLGGPPATVGSLFGQRAVSGPPLIDFSSVAAGIWQK